MTAGAMVTVETGAGATAAVVMAAAATAEPKLAPFDVRFGLLDQLLDRPLDLLLAPLHPLHDILVMSRGAEGRLDLLEGSQASPALNQIPEDRSRFGSDLIFHSGDRSADQVRQEATFPPAAFSVRPQSTV